MTPAVLDPPRSLFDQARTAPTPSRARADSTRPAAASGGGRLTLEERLGAALHTTHTSGSAECPVCDARMTSTRAGAECGGCGARLS